MDQSRSKHLTVRFIPRSDWELHLGRMAQLRLQVFREFPYLYEGSEAFELNYLKTYFNATDAGLIGAFDGHELVGLSTALPLAQATEEFREPLIQQGYRDSETFYFGESVLLPQYRGLGLGKTFFDLREAHARAIYPKLKHTSFCAVDRALNDPRRPKDYRPLDAFWIARGYQKHPQIQARFDWQEIGADHESTQTLTYWIKDWTL